MQKHRKRPTVQYAYRFFDYSLDSIGISLRTTNLLGTYHNVLRVRDLVRLSKWTIQETPQLGRTALDEVLQCMANIGVPVRDFEPDLFNIPEPPDLEEQTFGLPETEQFMPFILTPKR